MVERTYREKLLWWNLAPNIVIALVLIGTLFTTFDVHHHPAAVLACIALYYFGNLGQTIFTVYFAGDMRTDERDRDLEGRATRSGYAFLSGAIFVLIVCAANFGFDQSPRFLVWLFLIWVMSRIVRDASELRLHAGHTGLWPDFIVERQRRRSRERMENPTPRQLETARRFVERERRKGRM